MFKPFTVFKLKKNGSHGGSNAWGFERFKVIDALTRKFVEKCKPIFRTKQIALSHAGKKDIIIAAKDKSPFRIRRIKGTEPKYRSFPEMQTAMDEELITKHAHGCEV